MASIFLENKGIIMIDYLEQGRTLNGSYYADELRRLRQEIARKRRGQLSQGVLLLHNYVQDPSNFYLFPKLKTKLRGRRFGSNEGATEAVNEFFEDQIESYILKG
jgi:hypothetical protein